MSNASTIKEIKTTLEGIGHILADRRLMVPAYQRSYAWEDRQVNDLFQDLDTAMRDGLDEYFLGSIVLIRDKNDPERPQLVDGQQRLATTTILLSAIRDHFASNGETQRAETIETKYLFLRDLRSQELIPRLQLNQIDHDFFVKRVLSKPTSAERTTEPTKDSHERIARAAELAAEHVTNLLRAHSKNVEIIIDIVEYLDNRAPVITVEVPDHANAFRIFETLNDRGLDLAISDLLKNYLFHLSGNRMSEVQQRWMEMLGTLEAVGGEEITVQYIRHLWSSKYGLTRERDLYDRIKRQLTSKQSAIDFAGDLATNARVYAAINNTDHELWTSFGTTAKGHMAILNQMGMIQIRPLLLAILAKFTSAEVKKALRLFVAWAVRFLVVGGLGGGTLESHYSQRAKEVTDGTIKNTSQLLKAMRDVIPTDPVFQNAFSTATVSKPALGRYYLLVLEKQIQGEAEPEFIPNPNEEEVNLEHVLPQTPSVAWGSIDADTAKAYYKRLGNLALLKTRVNQAAANRGFAEKKKHYQNSEFALTKSIANEPDWSTATIEKRQQDLAALAVAAWPNKF